MFSFAHRLFPGHSAAVAQSAETDAVSHPIPSATRERTLLDLVLPDYHYRGVVKMTVKATPEEILRAIEEVTLADMPLAYAIGTLRYLPGRLMGKQRPADDEMTRPFLEVAMPLRLGEDPGREIVIGSVGKFHNLLDQQMVDLPDLFTFTRFNDAGYQKLAMNFRAVPTPDGAGANLMSEHRTLALSSSSRRKFAVYWYLMVGWGSNFMLRQMLNAAKRLAETNHATVARVA